MGGDRERFVTYLWLLLRRNFIARREANVRSSYPGLDGLSEKSPIRSHGLNPLLQVFSSSSLQEHFKKKKCREVVRGMYVVRWEEHGRDPFSCVECCSSIPAQRWRVAQPADGFIGLTVIIAVLQRYTFASGHAFSGNALPRSSCATSAMYSPTEYAANQDRTRSANDSWLTAALVRFRFSVSVLPGRPLCSPRPSLCSPLFAYNASYVAEVQNMSSVGPFTPRLSLLRVKGANSVRPVQVRYSFCRIKTGIWRSKERVQCTETFATKVGHDQGDTWVSVHLLEEHQTDISVSIIRSRFVSLTLSGSGVSIQTKLRALKMHQ